VCAPQTHSSLVLYVLQAHGVHHTPKADTNMLVVVHCRALAMAGQVTQHSTHCG
jgi:hypothetical protein